MSGQLLLGPLFAVMRKRGAGEAELDAPLGEMQRFAEPEKRCTHVVDGKGTRCKWWFLASDPHDTCKTCRARSKKWNDSENATVCKAAWRDEHREEIHESGALYRADHKEQIAESNATYRAEHKEQIAESGATYRAEHREEIREKSLEYWHGEKHDHHLELKAVRSADPVLHAHDLKVRSEYKLTAAGIAANARYRASNARKLANARYREAHIEELRRKGREAAATPMGLLSASLRKMIAGDHWDPVSFPKLGSFQSNEEARAHFESFFEASGWMTWENRGAHQKENGYDQVWNIGHWLPRAVFDPTNEVDLRRCWHPDNLFPQCAKANTEYRDVLIYTDDELLERRHLWPVAANDDLDQLKGLFRYIAV